MAYTKVITLKASLNRAVKYVLNHEKTDLKNAIDYARNQDKNSFEETYLENSINCMTDTAYEEMQKTKEKWEKTDGNLGYHIIQSFAPNEVDAETAHKIGMQFAEECFGERFQVIISTHLDKNHFHNHLVINSVSFKDGIKYRSDFNSYYNGIRKISDDICKEYGLSVIFPSIDDKSLTYIEWLSAKKGAVSWQSIIKGDIDHAISQSLTYGAFLVEMERLGYETKHGKYLAFRPYGKERFSRGYKLGDKYSEQAIKDRIDGNEYSEMKFVKVKQNFVPYPKRYMSSMERKYWAWMYRLGLVKKHQARAKPSKYLKEELLKFERYKEQFKFLRTHSLTTESEFFSYVESVDQTIVKLQKNLYEFRTVLKKNNKLYDALFDLNNLKVASEMYQKGYSMMKKEHDDYKKAVQYLASNGFKSDAEINALEAEKANIYDQIAGIKKDIKYYRNEKRICNNIEGTIEQIEKKEKMIEEYQNSKDKRRKDVGTLWK